MILYDFGLTVLCETVMDKIHSLSTVYAGLCDGKLVHT